MKILFMGTPDFADCSLQRLLEENFEVVGVFCQPDRPKGRGQKTRECPVKQMAVESGLPVYQPETLRDGAVLDLMREISPDLVVVVAYGKILPEEMLALPKYGCINVHGSLLPAYRGSAPIQRAILNGEKKTGITTMYLAAEMDAGDIIYTAETQIGEKETAGALFRRLAPVGADLLVKTIRAIEAGIAPRIPQNPALATYAPPLSKEESPIDWGQDTEVICRHIYGMQPWPCATAEFGGMSFKVYAAEMTGHTVHEEPGTLIAAGKKGIEVVCGGGKTLWITELQAAGGKRMAAGAYLLGHPMEV